MKIVRIGSGAGYAGDRIEPAVDLIEHGELDYIGFECLAERTIALANGRKMKNPETGYDELLPLRMEHVLEPCVRTGTKLISSMGAANPQAAVRLIAGMARGRGLKLKIAAVLGDDVLSQIDDFSEYEILETEQPLKSIRDRIVSANAYLGACGIIEALRTGADMVITGRVADPALFLAPLMYEFGWKETDYERIGRGILCGHLLECSSQVSGGYYADPGFKEVPGLHDLGFPLAEVDESGEMVITKLEPAGGLVSEGTCKEQLLYEIQDPANYYTPDGIADFSNVRVKEVGKDRVRMSGATGREKTGKLKVSVGYRDGCIGEGEISYGGSRALEKARVAGEIVRHRLRSVDGVDELKIDYIGYNSLFDGGTGSEARPVEVRLRVAGRTGDEDTAKIIGNEVEALYLNGPSGGGGAVKSTRDVLGIGSIFIDKERIKPAVEYEVAE